MPPKFARQPENSDFNRARSAETVNKKFEKQLINIPKLYIHGHTDQKYFHTKIFHIKPFFFYKHSPEVIPYQIFLKFSPLKAELIGVYLHIFM